MNKRRKNKLRKRLGFKTWKRYRYERLFISYPTVLSYSQLIMSAKHLIGECDEEVYSLQPVVFKNVDDKGHIRPKV